MDSVTVGSLVVSVGSTILAIVAIVVSLLMYDRTKGVLAEIRERAAVIEKTVSGTQEKLVDTVTAIARPPKMTQEETLLNAVLANPELLDRLVEVSKKLPGKP